MHGSTQLHHQLQSLVTEQRNPRSQHIDTAEIPEILRIISDEDLGVAAAVRQELPFIAEAVKLIVECFQNGGRLFYVGAGTSGRLGILDASECPPTFGTAPDMVQGIIAGGPNAVFRSQEGAEDVESDGAAALAEHGVTARDIVCGIAASRRTPYVVGAVKAARTLGCQTLFVTCNPRRSFTLQVDIAICPVVGPEVIMGSTRMKSGTAQKLVLNMLTTAAMVRMGKVYENMMVDLQMSARKLVERSRRTVMIVTGLDYHDSALALRAAGGHVKTALVMVLASVDRQEAQRRLERVNGFVRAAIAMTDAAE